MVAEEEGNRGLVMGVEVEEARKGVVVAVAVDWDLAVVAHEDHWENGENNDRPSGHCTSL